jgi:hypothetical protein
MPYINPERRNKITNVDIGDCDLTAGDLNYMITRLCHQDIMVKGLRYAILNEVVGVLECAKAELLRVVAGKYEDQKRRENGAVSDLDARSVHDAR